MVVWRCCGGTYKGTFIYLTVKVVSSSWVTAQVMWSPSGADPIDIRRRVRLFSRELAIMRKLDGSTSSSSSGLFRPALLYCIGYMPGGSLRKVIAERRLPDEIA